MEDLARVRTTGVVLDRKDMVAVVCVGRGECIVLGYKVLLRIERVYLFSDDACCRTCSYRFKKSLKVEGGIEF